MLETFTCATFSPLVGQAFRAVDRDGAAMQLVLTRCEEAPGGRPIGAERVPFTLLFHAGDHHLVEQQTVTVHHAGLGEFPLFLVPLGPDANGMRYEAVFA